MNKFILYVTCAPESFKSRPNFEETNWEKLFSHHDFLCDFTNLSLFSIGNALEHFLLIETEANQEALNTWLSEWSKTVEEYSYFLIPLEHILDDITHSSSSQEDLKLRRKDLLD